MRKLKILVTFFCCLTVGIGNVIIGYAEKGTVTNITEQLYQLNVIDKSSNNNGEGVFRCDALVSILKVLGVKERNAQSASNGTTDVQWLFFDTILGENTNVLEKVMGEREYNYLIVATLYKHMVYGNGRNFRPFDAITVDEALAIMMRGIENETFFNLEEIHQYAQEKGLIQEVDCFYEDGSMVVTREDFELLLYRMINQPVFWYYEDGHPPYGGAMCYDYERSVKYVDILQGNYPETGRLWGDQEDKGIFPGDEEYKEYKN